MACVFQHKMIITQIVILRGLLPPIIITFVQLIKYTIIIIQIASSATKTSSVGDNNEINLCSVSFLYPFYEHPFYSDHPLDSNG